MKWYAEILKSGETIILQGDSKKELLSQLEGQLGPECILIRIIKGKELPVRIRTQIEIVKPI